MLNQGQNKNRTAHYNFVKSRLGAILFLSIAITVPVFADHITINTSTATQADWTVTSGGVTNATPFLFLNSATLKQVGLSISSRGGSNGFFLNGGDFSTFDGYWTATYKFYLPPVATNIVLNFTNLGFDDAGVLFLNTNVIAGTFTKAATNGITQGQIVLVDGDPVQLWNFTGPNEQVAGTVTNGFIAGTTNTLTAVVNNTGLAANGILRGFVSGDTTEFYLAATISYDVFPSSSSLAIAEYPGLRITGTIGGTYQVQYATNPTNNSWTALTNFVLPTSPYLFFDTNSIPGQPSRYYRAVAQ